MDLSWKLNWHIVKAEKLQFNFNLRENIVNSVMGDHLITILLSFLGLEGESIGTLYLWNMSPPFFRAVFVLQNNSKVKFFILYDEDIKSLCISSMLQGLGENPTFF